MGVFLHIRVQIVHQHSHRRFSQPAFGDFATGGWKDIADVMTGIRVSYLLFGVISTLSQLELWPRV